MHQVTDHPDNIRFRWSIAVVTSYDPGGKPKVFIPTSCRAGSTMSATVDIGDYTALSVSAAGAFFFLLPALSWVPALSVSAAGASTLGAGTVG